MALRVAIQADHPAGWNPKTDSTLRLGREAEARGFELFFYEPKHLSLRENGQVSAWGAPISFPIGDGAWHRLGDMQTLDLRTMDVVLMRQDPPFDMAYITATHILEMLTLPPSPTLPREGGGRKAPFVTNNPAAVRNHPEKIFPLLFSQFMPPTLISADRAAITAFQAEHQDIILKPLYGYAGNAVFHLKPGDGNLSALFDLYFSQRNEPLIAQKFLPEVTTQDRRIILIDGEVAGVMGRIPAAGEHRANFRVGGSPAAAELTPRQREICDALGPELRARGLLLAGLDCIGDYLTEINITSPTGFPGMHALYGIALEKNFWDAVEKKLQA